VNRNSGGSQPKDQPILRTTASSERSPHSSFEAVDPKQTELGGKLRLATIAKPGRLCAGISLMALFMRGAVIHAWVWESFLYNNSGHQDIAQTTSRCWSRLGAIASLASLLARSNSFKSMLNAGEPDPGSTASSSRYGFRSRSGSASAVRVVSKNYPGADLGLGG